MKTLLCDRVLKSSYEMFPAILDKHIYFTEAPMAMAEKELDQDVEMKAKCKMRDKMRYKLADLSEQIGTLKLELKNKWYGGKWKH